VLVEDDSGKEGTVVPAALFARASRLQPVRIFMSRPERGAAFAPPILFTSFARDRRMGYAEEAQDRREADCSGLGRAVFVSLEDGCGDSALQC